MDNDKNYFVQKLIGIGYVNRHAEEIFYRCLENCSLKQLNTLINKTEGKTENGIS